MSDDLGHLTETLVLYSDNRLPCPQRVLITAAELGIKLNIEHIDILKNEHKTSAYKVLTNDFSTVPYLTDGMTGFKLRESRAICRYLCLLCTGSSSSAQALLPSQENLEATARFEEAASVEVTLWDPVANRLALGAAFKPAFGGTVDEALVSELREKLQGVMDGLERHLTDGRIFMAGDTFTLVDVFYVPYMLKLTALYGDALFRGRAKLRRWWELVRGRESVRAIDGYGLSWS